MPYLIAYVSNSNAALAVNYRRYNNSESGILKPLYTNMLTFCQPLLPFMERFLFIAK